MRNPEGSVIHGIASCGNVYRILFYVDHPTMGEVCLLRIEKLEYRPLLAPDRMKVGAIIVRAESSWDGTHLAEGCPYAE